MALRLDPPKKRPCATLARQKSRSYCWSISYVLITNSLSLENTLNVNITISSHIVVCLIISTTNQNTHTQTHTHTHIYIYIYIYIWFLKSFLTLNILFNINHTVKWFQILLCITNDSIRHQSFVYTQLNDQTVLFQTIQFCISLIWFDFRTYQPL